MDREVFNINMGKHFNNTLSMLVTMYCQTASGCASDLAYTLNTVATPAFMVLPLPSSYETTLHQN